MRIPNRTTLITYGLLASAAGLSFLLPQTLTVSTAKAQSGPAEYALTGIVRDFLSTHPDFNVVPALGFGHYAGNIDQWLPVGTNRPVFNGGGYKVGMEWRDQYGRTIAPHLAGVQGAGSGGGSNPLLGVRVANGVELKSNSFIDGYDSNYGPYGFGGNFGADVLVTTNTTAPASIKLAATSYIRGDVKVGPGGDPNLVIQNMGIITGSRDVLDETFDIPEVDLPVNDVDGDDLENFVASLVVAGPVTLVGDTNPDDDIVKKAKWYGSMAVNMGQTLTIDGDLRIRVDGNVEIQGEIVLLPEASLALYVTGEFRVRDWGRVNMNTGDSTAVSVLLKGPGLARMDKSDVCATVVAPDRMMEIGALGNLYGTFMGDSMVLDKGNVHADVGSTEAGYQNFGLAVREEIKLEGTVLVDGFDSNLGPYGGANVGEVYLSTNSTKDNKIELKSGSVLNGTILVGPGGNPAQVISIDGSSSHTGEQGTLAAPVGIPLVTPPNIGPQLGHLHWTDGVARTINGDIRCKHLKIENNTIVTIQGDVTIRCDGKVEVKKGSEIRLAPGAKLTLYLKDELRVEEDAAINANTGNPQLVWIPTVGYGKDGKVQVKKNSTLVAWVQGVKSELKVEDFSTFIGSFAGKKAYVKGNSSIHGDSAFISTCADVSDVAGAAGPLSNEAVTSAASFDQWFQDVLGVNMAGVHSIKMTNNGSDVYEYLNSGFYPIDGKLLGNEGGTRNDYYTYSLAADFVHDACTGQWIEFQGGDGVWLFIDDQLILDLGGVTPFEPQIIELDRLGLAGGQTHTMRLFYAHRNSFSAVFRLRTNIEMYSRGVPPITAMFD